MPANWENSAVATGLEKVSFHSNPKQRQCQRMLKLPTALISHASKVMLKILQARLQQYVNRELPDVQAGFRKAPDAGKDWGKKEKGITKDEMGVWHHWLNGHGFGWTPGVGDGQGGLVCSVSCGCRVGHDWATELNWTEYLVVLFWLSIGLPFSCSAVTLISIYLHRCLGP